jgi:hypothetical protein
VLFTSGHEQHNIENSLGTNKQTNQLNPKKSIQAQFFSKIVPTDTLLFLSNSYNGRPVPPGWVSKSMHLKQILDTLKDYIP